MCEVFTSTPYLEETISKTQYGDIRHSLFFMSISLGKVESIYYYLLQYWEFA